MTAPLHRAQLLVCHQKIAARNIDRRHMRADGKPGLPGYVSSNLRFCDLHAYAWCFDCDMYVCDIHLNSRHETHDTFIEFPKSTFTPGKGLAIKERMAD